MMLPALAAAATLAAGDAASAIASENGFETCHLQVDHLRPGAPKFADFRTPPESVAHPARPQLRTPDARLFRTVLRTQAQLGSDFAGHYRVAVWGCGTGCLSFAVIDLRSGRVIFPSDFKIVDQNAASPLERLTYRPDSRLLIVTGAPDEDFSRLGVRFYVLRGASLKLTKAYRYGELCPPSVSN